MFKIDLSDFGLPYDEKNNRIFGERIKLPEFEINSNPIVRIVDLPRRFKSIEYYFDR